MTRKTNRTMDDLITQIRAIAEADPDFTYNGDGLNGCYYTRGSTDPESVMDLARGCIVGRALGDLGFVPAQFEELGLEGTAAIDVWDSLTHTSGTRVQEQWLTHLQSRQDLGHTWGDSIASADELYPLT